MPFATPEQIAWLETRFPLPKRENFETEEGYEEAFHGVKRHWQRTLRDAQYSVTHEQATLLETQFPMPMRDAYQTEEEYQAAQWAVRGNWRRALQLSRSYDDDGPSRTPSTETTRADSAFKEWSSNVSKEMLHNLKHRISDSPLNQTRARKSSRSVVGNSSAKGTRCATVSPTGRNRLPQR